MCIRALFVILFCVMGVGEVNGEPVWQQLSYGKVPDNPVPGGEPNTFVCRDFNGVPGRLANGKCYATWDGKEYSVDHYEGLSMAPGTYRWEWYSGFLPEGAIIGGSQGTGKDVYICRSPQPDEYTGQLTEKGIVGSLSKAMKRSRNGKFAPWTSTCYFGAKGFEVRTKTFLVLVSKSPDDKPSSTIAGAKLVGKNDSEEKPNPLLKSAPLFGGKMMTGTAIGIVAGTILPPADEAAVAALARSNDTLPRPINSNIAGEDITGLSIVSMENEKMNLQLAYSFSDTRSLPVYAGAFVYDSSGVAVNVGYVPVAVLNTQGTVSISLMFPDTDLSARYIVAFLMESGEQPFMNEHFDFTYNWTNGQLLAANAGASPMAPPKPPARSDLCNAYAKRAVEMQKLAIKRNLPNILPPVWSDNYSHHYRWCLDADEPEIYRGHQLRTGYLEQTLPGEFSGKSVQLPGEAHALDPGLGP